MNQNPDNYQDFFQNIAKKYINDDNPSKVLFPDHTDEIEIMSEDLGNFSIPHSQNSKHKNSLKQELEIFP